MSLRDVIAAGLRTVVGETTGFGETAEYRRITSGPVAEPRTYGAWTDIEGHFSGVINAEEYRDDHGAWMRTETAGFRCSDALRLRQGDQIRMPNDTSDVWAVVGIASSGVGTIRYDLRRQVPLKLGPNRAGDV